MANHQWPLVPGLLYLNGTSAQAVGGTQTFETYNLNTDNTAGITLNNNLSVNGVHTFANGLIATSATQLPHLPGWFIAYRNNRQPPCNWLGKKNW